jgi:hypothetical protein
MAVYTSAGMNTVPLEDNSDARHNDNRTNLHSNEIYGLLILIYFKSLQILLVSLFQRLLHKFWLSG